VTPSEKAKFGIMQIEEAILDLLRDRRREWMTRSEIAKALDIDRFSGYLTGGICNDLVARGILEFQPGQNPFKATAYRIKTSD
jgi:hypothetical protein